MRNSQAAKPRFLRARLAAFAGDGALKDNGSGCRRKNIDFHLRFLLKKRLPFRLTADQVKT
jgi:hypothetical protein